MLITGTTTATNFLESKGLRPDEIEEFYNIIKPKFTRSKNRIIQEIKEAVCEQLGVEPESIYFKSRKRSITCARQTIGYFLYRRGLGSLYEISTCFGTAITHHSTVLYGNKIVEDIKFSDPLYKHNMEVLEIKVNEILNKK